MTKPAERPPPGDPEVDLPAPALGPVTFDGLFRAERARVAAAVFALAGSAAVAEEITQEAFLRLHVHWDRISAYDHPEQWVRRVAVNLALSRRRRRVNEDGALRRLG